MINILAAILGFLTGSFPTAYLVVKKSNGLDITKEGSGNVGTLNSQRVTGSYLVGISVLLTDLLKGALPVLILSYFADADFNILVTSALASVAGHCYSPWIKFKGGKGLAVAAGSTLPFVPAVTVVWAFFWIVAFLFKRLVNYANIVATLLTGMLVIINREIMNSYSVIEADDSLYYGISLAAMMLIILSKHWNEIKKFINIKG